MNTVRLLIACVLAAPAGSSVAVSAPVGGVGARYDAGVVEVTARVDAPPAAAGCRARVFAAWAPAGTPVPRVMARASTAGLVNKSAADGAVSADTCQDLGDLPTWTRGTVRMQFRPGTLPPGAYRVCVRADLALRGGRRAAHTACGRMSVAPPRPQSKRVISHAA
ncbi:MAG: hypothetical protein KDC33_03360 [Thermoleophilia bacterium]|nr:hypothetical protein [Thermoleophilia bacterium]